MCVCLSGVVDVCVPVRCGGCVCACQVWWMCVCLSGVVDVNQPGHS